MAGDFFPQTIASDGESVSVVANDSQAGPHRVVGGITLDWSTVAALGAPVTWNYNFQVDAGKKALRYGQTLMRMTSGAHIGWWGPFDPDATDGRGATPDRNNSVILERSVREDDLMGKYPPVITGGRVFKERLLATAGTHSLAAGPTYAELEAAMPTLSYVVSYW